MYEHLCERHPRCIDTSYYSSPINLLNKVEIHGKCMWRGLQQKCGVCLYIHLYAHVNLQYTNFRRLRTLSFAWLNIQEIVPFFPFRLCAVCIGVLV